MTTEYQKMLNKIYIVGDALNDKVGKINNEIHPSEYLKEQFLLAIKEAKKVYTKEDFNTDVDWLVEQGVCLDLAEDFLKKLPLKR